MDTDAGQTPPFLGYFDVSTSGFAWKEPLPEQIQRRRATMDDVLIFDILLTAGGIKEPRELFPPSDVLGLIDLLNTIQQSQYDTLKKECLIYLLLKWQQDGREERFAEDRCLPPQFTLLADAYWMLDSGVNVARAVAILSDSRLNRDYASKIIHAISLSPNSSHLVVQYVKTAKPLLVEPTDIDTYAESLAETNFLEVWKFQRSFEETGEHRTRLLEKLLEWSISPEPRAQPLTALLSFPFSSFEEAFIHKYALEPPKSISQASLSSLRDLLCVRLIQQGNYGAAIKLDHQFASSTINESKADSQDRRKMVRDVYEALPAVERLQLDLELVTLSKDAAAPKPTGRPVVNGRSSPTKDADGDLAMSQSWEEIPRPTSVGPKPSSPAPAASTSFRDIIPPAPSTSSIPERAGAPRFGGSTFTPAAQASPVIPISAPSKPAAKPRQSFPFAVPLGGFSASPSNQASHTTKPRQSFGQPLSFASTSSVPSGLGSLGGGLKFPSSTSVPKVPAAATNAAGPSGAKVPASRQANAFYTPPVQAQPNPLKRTFAQSHVEHEPRAQKDFDAQMAQDGVKRQKGDDEMDKEEEDHDEDVHMDEEPEDRLVENKYHDSDGEKVFEYSVFSGQPAPSAPKTRRQDAADNLSQKSTRSKKAVQKTPARSTRSKKVLPGGLTSEDEEGAPLSPTTTTRSGRSSRRTQKEEKPTRAQPVRAKKTKPTRKSLPGALALTDDDDDDEEHDGGDEQDEAEDDVAPLREASPVPAVRKAARKPRASATPEISDGEGPQTRRRSSRLSIAGSVSGEPTSPTASKEKKGKAKATGTTKKSSGTSGTRKKK